MAGDRSAESEHLRLCVYVGEHSVAYIQAVLQHKLKLTVALWNKCEVSRCKYSRTLLQCFLKAL